MKQPKPFNAKTVPLQDSNLIEASAGTGKTYSIAILFLRLILEKKMSVREILMVTFTKAAVAELEERIRLFVREAYKASLGEGIKYTTITELVQSHPDEAEAKNLLHAAVLFLDETSVLTIHSFCQKALNEFAFETNQLFGADTLHDLNGVIEDQVNQYWRQYITSIPAELLKQLLEHGLSRDSINQTVKEHLGGKRYYTFDSAEVYSKSEEEDKKYIEELESLKNHINTLQVNLLQFISNNSASLKTISEANSHAKKGILHLIETPLEFLNAIITKRGSGYINELYPDILQMIDEYDEANKRISEKAKEVIDLIKCHAIQSISKDIETYKLTNNQMSYDDMIVKLHHALVIRQSEKLVAELQKKYKAVFIDEFQDTDRLQYELFQKAFSENTILFYIGDPKQSIYAWRKADIFTYFKASDAVKNIYDMNLNYRSSVPLIDAMNLFFNPEADFDTFYFGQAEHAIKYIRVASPANNTKGEMWLDSDGVIPISITEQPNNDGIKEATTAQVIDILENSNYKLGEKGKERGIRPSDIGILVRSNRQGREMKAILSKYGIPAVTISDEKVLQSDEAKSLLYLLEAMLDISRVSVNKALLSPFTGFTRHDIIQLDDEKALALFRKYKKRWEEDGIYTALIDFVVDCNVHQILLSRNGEHGERIITNLYQLIELVHKVQTTKVLSPVELISWLRRGIEGMEMEGDEYEQRMESDEEAVKIVTIHKSKGLEYNIVLAPFLDLLTINEFDMVSYRDPNTGDYVSLEKGNIDEEQEKIRNEQAEQENRRLIYVAITRAVYKCFIYKSTSSRGRYNYSNSSLATFTKALVNASEALIGKGLPIPIPDGYNYTHTSWQPVPKIENVQFELSHQNWTMMSYSRLAAKNLHPTIHSRIDHEDGYDQFVFRQLTKGERTGNMLHQIFENINYSQNSGWPKIITTAIRKYAPRQEKVYEEELQRLVEQVLMANIQTEKGVFNLAQIDYEKRIHEFEFDFPVSPFLVSELSALSNDVIQLNVKGFGELEGIMNGKIDLFFEHEGKYYILDWKSNYLGDNMEDYLPAALADAMSDHNYHLQYLIYTLATKKYLESRLPRFDYERDFGGVLYLFIRGMRKGFGNGIFYSKPTLGQIDALDDILSKKVQMQQA